VRVRERLISKSEEAAREHKIPLVRAVVAGSAARGTFLSDRLDIDLFLLFPPELPRTLLEEHGLALGRKLFDSGETRYAEHPYLRGEFEGFSVDAVPGYAITDPAHPKTAVDRTPFHNEYLQRHENREVISEIRLTKQFLRGQGIYGSEAKTQGLSGYAVELLLVKFGTLDALLGTARRWRPPVRIEFTPGSKPRVPPEVPLVMDDPVDPNRNVTSALSMRNFATLVFASQAYLEQPNEGYFQPFSPGHLTRAQGLRRMHERGTHVAGLALPRPPLVDDILYPQLVKGARAIAEEARRLGFHPVGSSSAAGDRTITFLLETEESRLPAARSQDGPPPGVGRADSFLEKWTRAEAPVLQGPFVAEDGRLAVETKRPMRELEPLLTASLETLSIGRDLVKGVPPGSAFVPLADAAETAELPRALGELFDKTLPWRRRVAEA
jgi:tRNA nucleotidyltransferase (CCA-adding enzyme)